MDAKTERSLQLAIQNLKKKYLERDKIRQLPLDKHDFTPDLERLDDLPKASSAKTLLEGIDSKYAVGLKDSTELDRIEGGRVLSNILRAIQSAKFTYDVVVFMSLGIDSNTIDNWDKFGKFLENLDLSLMKERVGRLGGDLDLTYDVSRRIKRIYDITSWRLEFINDPEKDSQSEEGYNLTPSEIMCCFPFKKKWAILFALVPRFGPTLSVKDARNETVWKAVMPCVIKDDVKVLSPRGEKLVTQIWSDPARAGFRGTRATWTHLLAQNILGISEVDIHTFLKKQEVSQRAKTVNSKSIYTPIVAENIGHVQMDLIVVKFSSVGDRARIRAQAENKAGLAGGELTGGATCDIICRRVTRAIKGPDGPNDIEVVTVSNNDVANLEFKNIGRSSNQYVYILTIIDLFSKFVWAFPLVRKSAGQVVACLENLWLTEGAPLILQSDNGTEFINDEVAALSARFNVERRVSRPYNSQSNGAIERLNRTLQTALTRSLYTYHSNRWDELLPLVVYAYNTTRHSTTNLCPFLIQRGREPAPLGNVLIRPTKVDKPAAPPAPPPPEPEERKALPRNVKRKPGLGGGEIQTVLEDIEYENKKIAENVFKDSRKERYAPGTFDIAKKDLKDLIEEDEEEEKEEEGHTYRMVNDKVVEIEEDEEKDVLKGTAELLATNEARRKFVHDRIQKKATQMVQKSIEKYGQMKGIAVLKTDEFRKRPFPDWSIPVNVRRAFRRTSEGQRVRLSLLFYSNYRRENKSPFRRGSVSASLWSEYTFRVMGQESMLPVGESFIPKYWIRLEEGEVHESELDAMIKVSYNGKDAHFILAERQQLLPIPDETIKIEASNILTFASRVPRPPEVDRNKMIARSEDLKKQVCT